MTPPVILSVVAPCFNEEAVLAAFHERMSKACSAAVDGSGAWEMVLVNDGSHDRTFEVMKDLVAADPRVVAINLARNFGHQIALTAGLAQCRGDRVLMIDADLQDPPELLAPMMQAMDAAGADVVYGQRRKRAGETRFKTWTAAIFYRLFRSLVDIDVPLDAGDFRLMNRRALDVLNQMPEQHRFVRGLVAWIGLRQIPFPYDRAARVAGETGYPFVKMVRFAMDAITSFSVLPLRLASLFGVFIGVLGILGLAYTLGSWAFGFVVQGWTSVATIVLIIGGVQLILLGVFGEYLGRLYLEAKRRPLYVIDTVLARNMRVDEDSDVPGLASVDRPKIGKITA